MEELNKRYYGIREVAELLGVEISQLRFYEKEFPTLKPRKNRAGDRIYTKVDIDHLKEILTLVKEKGYTLRGAREYLKSRSLAQSENAKMIAKLQEIKGFLQNLRDGIEREEL
ncbi:MerR family transcriptional regulator [Nibrella viscosa]|uniref:MerR family transcriptional regulator n=1 Tax=Nibrella viscosa TaxID=1084524 RepID=A0ABP8KJW4_9BACT